MLVVLMGVSGSGKTTIGTLLGQREGWSFVDADDYHPLANKEKMAAGHALNDADRKPWLEALNGVLRDFSARGASCVLACSALKASYRDILNDGMPEGAVRFVLLDGSPDLIAERLSARHHEFMNATLLASQLAVLERPDDAVAVCNDRAAEAVVAEIVERLGIVE